MASDIVRPDSSGRISLARFGVQPGQTFEVVKAEETGRIILYPVKNYLQQFATLPIGQAFTLPGEHSGGYVFVKTGNTAMVRIRDTRTKYYAELKDGYGHWAQYTDALVLQESDEAWA